MKKNKFWTPDRIVTLTAMFISLFTLVVFVRQTSIIEKQSRLSVMPYLIMETGYNPEDDLITLTLNNYGVGPAIIEGMKIFYNGNTYETDFANFLQTGIFEKDSVAVLASASIDEGLAIPAGAERIAIKFGGSGDRYIKTEKFLRKLERNEFDYEIVYRSIYNDFWRIGMVDDIPEVAD
ncbi:hypothetical protein [Croceitalea rosinachiae]|uniref:Uncharacterized protein n=1 Tax=Croceitalea rosinachiae TaxID=3075596 RepID=A0ABU3A9F4_9FLAO|nr:hypothetical protein [Croceitalea sp. F388]MDT0605713.1 hypothetical protein [Croceitalea sp. F388]